MLLTPLTKYGNFEILKSILKCNKIWIEPVPRSNFSCLYLVTVCIILIHILCDIEIHSMTLKCDRLKSVKFTCEFSLETEPLKVGGARC